MVFRGGNGGVPLQTPFLLSLYLTSLSDLSSPSTTPLYLITSLSLSLLLLGL